MKTYNLDPRNYYMATTRIVNGHPDRAVIVATNKMSVDEFFPVENDGWKTEASILFTDCMGFDPEEFDPKSNETRKWVEEWSYPVNIAKAIVAQINHK